MIPLDGTNKTKDTSSAISIHLNTFEPTHASVLFAYLFFHFIFCMYSTCLYAHNNSNVEHKTTIIQFSRWHSYAFVWRMSVYAAWHSHNGKSSGIFQLRTNFRSQKTHTYALSPPPVNEMNEFEWAVDTLQSYIENIIETLCVCVGGRVCTQYTILFFFFSF